MSPQFWKLTPAQWSPGLGHFLIRIRPGLARVGKNGRLLQYGEAVVRHGQEISPQRHQGEFEGALVTGRDGLRVLGRRGPQSDLSPRHGTVIRVMHHTSHAAKNRRARRPCAERSSENKLEDKHSTPLKKTHRRFDHLGFPVCNHYAYLSFPRRVFAGAQRLICGGHV